uniref:Peptidase A2 domain-containing protein n=1 Tax=Trichogramma kaykai TaxID=54128 RepID=A0ABD2W5Z7_9HYME
MYFENQPLAQTRMTTISNFRIIHCSRFIPFVKIDMFDLETLFLLDTGAQMSLISIKVLPPNAPIDDKNLMNIEGIERNPKPSLGRVRLNLFDMDVYFQVVDDSFQIPGNGILGSNFLHLGKAIVNFDELTLTANEVTTSLIIKTNQLDSLEDDAGEIIKPPEIDYGLYADPEDFATLDPTDHIPESRIFTIRQEDLKDLIKIDHLNETETADLNTRVQKWRFKLSVYDYTVVYKKGKSNVNADSLSRNIPEESDSQALCVVTRSKDKEIAEKEKLESTPTPPVPKRGRPPKHLQKPKPAPPPRDTDKRQTKQTEKYDPSPTPKPPEPDPRTFNIPQSESENSSESEQESSEEEDQSQPEAIPIQPENIPTEPSQIENQSPSEQVSAENTTKSTIDIVYSKDLMHCVAGNIAYFIDTNGKPIDAGATKLLEFHKLPTFTDLSVGDVLIHNTKQEKNHFALCLKDESPLAPSSCKANLETLFSTLKELLKKTKDKETTKSGRKNFKHLQSPMQPYNQRKQS